MLWKSRGFRREPSVAHVNDGGLAGIASDPWPVGGVNACISGVTAVRPQVGARAITEVE